MIRRIIDCNTEGIRNKGHSRLRWLGEDPRRLRIKGWWKVIRARESWRQILREAEA